MTITHNFSIRIQYEDAGRSGNLTAFFEDFQLHCYYEFCGGNALVSIAVPGVNDWKNITGKSEEDRIKILTVLANKIQEEKFSESNVGFEISDKHITFKI